MKATAYLHVLRIWDWWESVCKTSAHFCTACVHNISEDMRNEKKAINNKEHFVKCYRELLTFAFLRNWNGRLNFCVHTLSIRWNTANDGNLLWIVLFGADLSFCFSSALCLASKWWEHWHHLILSANLNSDFCDLIQRYWTNYIESGYCLLCLSNSKTCVTVVVL